MDFAIFLHDGLTYTMNPCLQCPDLSATGDFLESCRVENFENNLFKTPDVFFGSIAQGSRLHICRLYISTDLYHRFLVGDVDQGLEDLKVEQFS